MSDERTLTLRQADEARADFYAISDDLDFIKSQLARLPTRGQLAQAALGIIFCSTALTVAAFELLVFR